MAENTFVPPMPPTLLDISHVRGLHFYKIYPKPGDRLEADMDTFFKGAVRLKDWRGRIVGHIGIEECDYVADFVKQGLEVWVTIPEGAKVFQQILKPFDGGALLNLGKVIWCEVWAQF